ncbi:MAG: DASS family sodium-coupled anion symporter [Chromatiales bacterium]|nr:DASS family sodium-coupled anion symporter [Chromatiales bacterium]
MKQAQRKRQALLMLPAALAAAATASLLLMAMTGLPREACIMAGIFLLAALLWATEALPLFATSLLVIGLQTLLLANPGGWPGLGFEQGDNPGWQHTLTLAVDPVLFLFFGGFLLARAGVREGVDGAMASMMLKPCGGRPLLVLLGIMVTTAVFSMWMSNTATAAMMIALVVPLLARLPSGDPFRKALVLGVAFAANIGGMGTPIGSPPNAVAIGYLERAGLGLTFIEWMVLAVPLMGGLLLFAWMLLWFRYPPSSTGLELTVQARPMNPRGWFVVGIFTLTVLLWLSEPVHGLPAAVVALLPAIVFTAGGILDRSDVNGLEWNILILIGGGIALGGGMRMTGLDEAISTALGTAGVLELGLLGLALLASLTLALSTFMSNTAAANLLLPIAISLATGLGPGDSGMALQFALCIALTASVSMALPVSTPPNAIAYARGEVSSRDMLVPGTLIGLVAVAVIVAGSRVVIGLFEFG